MKNKNTNLISISGAIESGKDTVADMIRFVTHKKKFIITGGSWNSKYQFKDWRDGGKLRRDWEIKKFAGKLKEVASLLLGVPVEKFEDRKYKDSDLGEEWSYSPLIFNGLGKAPKEEEKKYTVREFLQKLGTEGLRNGLHENVWVNALFADYNKSGYAINLRHLQDLCKTPIEITEEVQSLYGGDWQKYISDNKLPASTVSIINGSKWIITDTRFPNELQAVEDRNGITIKLTRNQNVESKHSSETALDNAEFDYVINNQGQSLEETFDEVVKMVERFNIK